MKIQLLGTATSQGVPVIGCECPTCQSTDPKDNRSRAACMVEVGGKRLVIDVGPDFRQQMLAAGGQEIHGILVTHEHNDHVAGLDDVRPFNFRYHKHIPVYALPRVVAALEKRYDYIFDARKYPGLPQVELHRIEGYGVFGVAGIAVQPIQVMHGKLPILGFRIHDFAYLTDVKTIPESQFPLLENLEVLVISALQEEAHNSHLTLEEAIALARKINAKQTIFTHFSHTIGSHEALGQKLPTGIVAGHDGATILCE